MDRSVSQIAKYDMPSFSTCEFVPYLSIDDAKSAVAFYSRIFGVAPHLVLNGPRNLNIRLLDDS